MAINQLPPQAYTKETLARAYEWLHRQTPAVKEMATSAEILIGLYTRAQRHGEEALDRPSIQNFKSELKNLAGIMGEFTDQNVAPPKPPSKPTQEAPAISPSAQASFFQTPAPQAPIYEPPPQTYPRQASPAEMVESLDIKSRTMIHEVKNQLNLSSDTEALRMLVSLGFHRARSLWTKPD